MTQTLAIDCMGGDSGCAVTVPAAGRFLKQHAKTHPQLRLILCGDEKQITPPRSALHLVKDPRIEIRHTDEFITMDDSLETALRKKRKSSLHLALHAVKDGAADACISAGNTGALMAVSRYVLKTLAMLERPALCALLPNQSGKPTYVLDLGANIDCNADQLHQFAIMGSVFAGVGENIAPRVGLMNVGTEEIKGGEQIKAAFQLLQNEHERGEIVFVGYVEGNDIFEGTVDVVVCDGFAGNVALKAVEGLGSMVKGIISKELRRNPLTILGSLLAFGGLRSIKNQLSPSRYNGACLLGLKGLVYKSHGSTSILGFENALIRAHSAVERGLMQKMTLEMEKIFVRR